MRFLPSELFQEDINVETSLPVQERDLRGLLPRLPFARTVTDGATAQPRGGAGGSGWLHLKGYHTRQHSPLLTFGQIWTLIMSVDQNFNTDGTELFILTRLFIAHFHECTDRYIETEIFDLDMIFLLFPFV